MKKLLILVLAIFLSLSFTMPVSADRRGKQKRNSQGTYQKQERRPNNHYRSGYRYRHHGHRRYHPNHYRGHWRSWNQWDRHRRHNHQNYRHGRYYRKNNNLYFEFETDEGRFVFSIGR